MRQTHHIESEHNKLQWIFKLIHSRFNYYLHQMMFTMRWSDSDWGIRIFVRTAPTFTRAHCVVVADGTVCGNIVDFQWNCSSYRRLSLIHFNLCIISITTSFVHFVFTFSNSTQAHQLTWMEKRKMHNRRHNTKSQVSSACQSSRNHNKTDRKRIEETATKSSAVEQCGTVAIDKKI